MLHLLVLLSKTMSYTPLRERPGPSLSRNHKNNKRKTERNMKGREIARSCIASMANGDNYCRKVVLALDSKCLCERCVCARARVRQHASLRS